ncbi:MAG TPA: hypothetical protein VJR87_03465 [Allosphingosinicella sp.]|nr:hypothetical protein [Allosphingosinicella sp.]
MKKIALTVAVLASIGLAACKPSTESADTNTATDINATTEQGVTDVNAAATEAADNALDNAATTNATDTAAGNTTNAM